MKIDRLIEQDTRVPFSSVAGFEARLLEFGVVKTLCAARAVTRMIQNTPIEEFTQ